MLDVKSLHMQQAKIMQNTVCRNYYFQTKIDLRQRSV